jgi:hypothetical protein
MESLIINEFVNRKAPNSPDIDFDVNTGILLISGQSFMENSHIFYDPVLKWLKQFVLVFKNKIVLNFKLTYFNSGSSKNIYTMLEILKKFENNGGTLEINWFYVEADTDIKEDFEDLAGDIGIHDLKFISY